MMTYTIILFFVILFRVYSLEKTSFLDADYIESINKLTTTWKAGVNFDPNTPEKVILNLLGSRGVGGAVAEMNSSYKTDDPKYEIMIPVKFDARKQWLRCKTIGAVRDQGHCGSSWAFGTTGALADRLCIATDADFNQLVSAEHLTYCCYRCGVSCLGGYPIKAWRHFARRGTVTGGNYNTTDGCQPYKVPPCLHYQKGENSCTRQPLVKSFHRCSKTCYGNKSIDFKSDHRKTIDSYYLAYEAIQKDLKTYGPVEASFEVYDDFLHYKSGIYVKTDNATYLGGHSVKLIGWGVEYGVEYWLMVNSWGTSWGDDGVFKIRKGTNECGVDRSATAGVPFV